MKTRSLARIIGAFSVTALIAVVSIGASTVFGVAAPTQTPDNSNGVSPTFSGLNIDDDMGGNITLEATTAFGGDSLSVNGGDGVILNGSSIVKALIMIGDLAQNRIVTIEPNRMYASGSFRMTATAAENVTIGAGMNDNTLVIRNDNVVVNSATDSTPAGAGAFKIVDAVGRWLTFDSNEIMSHGGPLYLNNDAAQNVIVGSAGTNSNLIVNGKITAESVGTVTVREKPRDRILAGSNRQQLANCEAGEVMLSCGLSGWADANSQIQSTLISQAGVHMYDNGQCAVGAYNTSPATYYYSSYAVCFDASR